MIKMKLECTEQIGTIKIVMVSFFLAGNMILCI